MLLRLPAPFCGGIHEQKEAEQETDRRDTEAD